MMGTLGITTVVLLAVAFGVRAEDSGHGRSMSGANGLSAAPTQAPTPAVISMSPPQPSGGGFNYSGKQVDLKGAELPGGKGGAPAPGADLPAGNSPGGGSFAATTGGSTGASSGTGGSAMGSTGGTGGPAVANSSLNDGSVQVAKGVTKFEKAQDLDIGVHEQIIDDRTGKKINANDIANGRVPVGTVVDEVTPSGRRVKATVEISEAQTLARDTGRNVKDPRFTWVDLVGASEKALQTVFGLKAVNPNTTLRDHDIRRADLPYYEGDQKERDRISVSNENAVVEETVLKPTKNGDATIIGGSGGGGGGKGGK